MRGKMHRFIQLSILDVVRHPNFEAALPPLSDETWLRLLSNSDCARLENERLEFLGDALMDATIGRQLYKQIPNGTPHLYTSLVAALHSNVTFSHIAEKSNILAVSDPVLKALTSRAIGECDMDGFKTKTSIKQIADLFETVIGAYYFDEGFESLCAWAKDIYTPLISAAEQAFYKFQRGGERGAYQDFTVVRLRRSIQRHKMHHLNKPTEVYSSQRVLGLQKVGSPSPDSRAGPMTRTLPRSSVASGKLPVPPNRSRTPDVIDLTLETDSSEEESAIEQVPPRTSLQARKLRIYARETPSSSPSFSRTHQACMNSPYVGHEALSGNKSNGGTGRTRDLWQGCSVWHGYDTGRHDQYSGLWTSSESRPMQFKSSTNLNTMDANRY